MNKMYGWGSDTSDKWSGGGGFNYGSAKKAYNPDKAYLSSPKKCSCSSGAGSSFSDDMKSVYMVSTRILDAALPKTAKKSLEKLTKSDIIVVPGSYDSVEKVLKMADTPHRVSSARINLDPKQTVFINCPGNHINFGYKGKSGLDCLSDFVEDGGFLVTTDWALESIIMKSFPGYITHAGTDTGDDVVEVDRIAANSPYTRGLGKGSLRPVWWLEGASYPIKPLRNKDLDILLASQEMEKRYGHGPIAVKFHAGKGRVIHVTSHFYLQTSKSKYDAQSKFSGLDFATKFIGMAKKDASQIPDINSVSFGALESAYTSIRFLHNILVEKMKRNDGKNVGLEKAVSLKKLPPASEIKKSKKLI